MVTGVLQDQYYVFG